MLSFKILFRHGLVGVFLLLLGVAIGEIMAPPEVGAQYCDYQQCTTQWCDVSINAFDCEGGLSCETVECEAGCDLEEEECDPGPPH